MDFPIKSTITIIPPDSSPRKLLLNWKIFEYEGTETYNLSDFFLNGGSIGDYSSIPSGNWKSEWRIGKIAEEGIEVSYPKPGIWTGKVVIPVARKIAVGDVLIILGFFASVATVTKVEEDLAMAETECNLHPLSFGKDDRNCWVCTCCINKNISLARMNFDPLL